MNYACIGALENSWTRASECHNSGYHVKSGGGGYGATAARLTPDQKVGNSNLSALMPEATSGDESIASAPYRDSHEVCPLRRACVCVYASLLGCLGAGRV